MPADLASSLVVFVVSAVIVVVDGQIIRTNGRTYLRAVYPDPGVAESINQLIAVLFHLLALGVLALLMASPSGNRSLAQALETKLGLALLIVAVAHGAAMLTLSKVRARHEEAELQQHLALRSARTPPEGRPSSPAQNYQSPDVPGRDGHNSSDPGTPQHGSTRRTLEQHEGAQDVLPASRSWPTRYN